MDNATQIKIIETKIQEEIKRYNANIHEKMHENPQILVDINPKKKFEVLETILMKSEEGFIFGWSKNDDCEELCDQLSFEPDRYKKRKIRKESKTIWDMKNYWTNCLYYGKVLFYMHYDEAVLTSIFSNCSCPVLLGNPNKVVGSRLQTIRKKVAQDKTLLIISITPESEGLIIFSSIELLHQLFDISLKNGNLDQSAPYEWNDLLWEKIHLENPQGIDDEKFKMWGKLKYKA